MLLSGHFRVHLCVDLYLPIIIPPIIAETRYEQAPVVKIPVNKDVLSLHLSSCVMLKSTSFSLVGQREKNSSLIIFKRIRFSIKSHNFNPKKSVLNREIRDLKYLIPFCTVFGQPHIVHPNRKVSIIPNINMK